MKNSNSGTRMCAGEWVRDRRNFMISHLIFAAVQTDFPAGDAVPIKWPSPAGQHLHLFESSYEVGDRFDLLLIQS